MPSSARPGLAQAAAERRRLTIDLAQRLGARRRRVSRAAFANQQRGINSANEAALGPDRAPLAIPIRSAPTRASLNAGRLAPSAPFPDPIQRRLGARRGDALSRGGDEEE